MDRNRSSCRLLDFAFIALVASGTVGITWYAYSGGAASHVSIQSPAGEWIYNLDTDTSFPVTGPIGETIVGISDGRARIVDSPCQDKICVVMGELSHTGEWSACLPNGVLVRIIGERDDVDAIAY